MPQENKGVFDFNCKSCSKEPTDKINVMRFIQKLDGCFAENDTETAVQTVEFWENEARRLNDKRGLLTVLNEQLGLFRNIGDSIKAQMAVEKTAELLAEEGEITSLSKATVLINLATTLKSLGKPLEAMPYYEKADEVYTENSRLESYEYAAMLNNKSAALSDLKRYDEAEEALGFAIEILNKIGGRDVEIALSYANLAQMLVEKGDFDTERIENLLDSSWEYINSPNQPRDGNYAFVISKCVPIFETLGRELEAEALSLTAKEIYSK